MQLKIFTYSFITGDNMVSSVKKFTILNVIIDDDMVYIGQLAPLPTYDEIIALDNHNENELLVNRSQNTSSLLVIKRKNSNGRSNALPPTYEEALKM